MARGASISSVLHFGLAAGIWALAALSRQGQPASGRIAVAAAAEASALDLEPMEISLQAADLIDPSLISSPSHPAAPPQRALPEADESVADARAARRNIGLESAEGIPAPDHGDGEGRRLPPSWRRDTSTLRSRLSDGASVYKPARSRTSKESSSPQAIRREARVGAGDSVRTARPRAVETPPVTAEARRAQGDERDERPATSPPALVASRTPGDDTFRGDGPLNVQPGPRSFDVQRVAAARDNVASRLASNERHPGLTDFGAVATPGASEAGAGRGPGAPGVTAHETRGLAASAKGVPERDPRSDGAGEGTAERRYHRQFLEIANRIGRFVRFPKRLALLLHQGEAIVQFLVESNGRVRGEVKLLKSAGFAEFDREAIEVVRRAEPFATVQERLLVRMRVPFQNPLIR